MNDHEKQTLSAQGKILRDGPDVTAEYRSMTHFREQVAVSARLEQYNSVRFTISYEVRNAETGELRCTGTTSHCFLDRDYKPIILRKVAPDYDTVFKGALRAENE